MGIDEQLIDRHNERRIYGTEDEELTTGALTSMLQSNRHGPITNNNRKRGRLRHESTDTDTSEVSAGFQRVAPDGGYGWVVVFAAFFVNLIADGVTFSFGVFYVEFNKYFGSSKSGTAWIGSLLASMPLLSGPIASSLTDRFGCRKVTIAGSLLSTLGFILSSYANSVEMLYLTFGVITGFGLSLCYVAAVVIVAYYFEQRRSLATGLSVCGGGIGTLIFAPLTAELINTYGWRGTTLLLAGAFLNLCVCGALMKDLEWQKQTNFKRKFQKPPAHHPCVDLVSSEISTLKKERLCNSAICIPTFFQQEQDRQNIHHRTQFRTHTSENFQSLPNQNYMSTHLSDSMTNLDGSHSVNSNNNNDTVSTATTVTPKIGRKSSSVNSTVTLMTNGDVLKLSNVTVNAPTTTAAPIYPNDTNDAVHLQSPLINNTNTNNICNNNPSSMVNSHVVDDKLSLNNDDFVLMDNTTIASSNPLTSHDNGTDLTTVLVTNLTNQMPSQTIPIVKHNRGSSWSAIHRHSLTYRGAILSLKRYRLRPASSCPDIISVATSVDDDRSTTHEWKAVIGDICKFTRGVCEWEHLSSSRFILFIISNLLLYMWYDVPYVYLQDAALLSNYSEDRSSYLISIVGFFNMVGNIILGYMGDKEWADAICVYGVCMALCGASTIVLPWCMAWNYVSLAISCAVFGLTIAANYSLTSVILVKVVSLERFTNAYGLLLLVQGIGNLLGPPLAGCVYDATGTSNFSFIIAGIGIISSSIFILAPKLLSRWTN